MKYTLLSLFSFILPLQAGASLLEEGQGSISLIYSMAQWDEYYVSGRPDTDTKQAFGDEAEDQAVLLHGEYGLSDLWNIDYQFGWVESSLQGTPVPDNGGLSDIKFGFKRSFDWEAMDDRLESFIKIHAFRVGGTIAGGYDDASPAGGLINLPGKHRNALDLSYMSTWFHEDEVWTISPEVALSLGLEDEDAHELKVTIGLGQGFETFSLFQQFSYIHQFGALSDFNALQARRNETGMIQANELEEELFIGSIGVAFSMLGRPTSLSLFQNLGSPKNSTNAMGLGLTMSYLY